MTHLPKMNHKGEAMWWIIIGAVLALLILIVLIMLFTGKTNDLNKGIGSCTGLCTASGEKSCPSGTQSSSAFECQTGGSCCIGFAKTCTQDTKEKDCAKDEECKIIGDKGKYYCVPN